MTHIRIRWKQFGRHIHSRIFTATSLDGTYANCGYAVYDIDEWPDIQELIKAEFIEEPELKEIKR